jgi:hypothetical protein
MILYAHCKFKTKHAGSPETFRLTFEGKASWDGKVVAGAKERITELAEFYRGFVSSTNDLMSVVCRWDKIKESRNLEQHGFDISAKLLEMIDFYGRHIALGDELQAEDLELYDFFRAFQAFKMHGSTVSVAISTSAPATAGYMPIGGGTSRATRSYLQAAAGNP